MENFRENKKIIYIILGVIVLTLLGFLAYRFLLAPGEKDSSTTGGVTGGHLPETPDSTGTPTKTPISKTTEIENLKPGEEIETAPEQVLTRLTDYPVISPILNPAENKIMFYKKDGGDLLSLNFDGTGEEKVSNVTIVGLLEAIWSGSRDKAGVFYLDGETLKGFLYLGGSGVAVLPQNIKGFSWSPDGKSLAYLILKDFELDLVIADSSGKNPKVVFSTPILDSQIKWIASDKLAFQTAPSAYADGFIFIYSRSNGSFTRIVGPIRGLTSLWSPDGSRAIISSFNIGGLADTQTIDNSGENGGPLSFKTFPEKCAWSGSKKLFCALPQNDRFLLDQYLRGEANTEDRIISYDLDLKAELGFFSEGAFDISDLEVTKDERYIFWVNRRDGTLWSLKLK